MNPVFLKDLIRDDGHLDKLIRKMKSMEQTYTSSLESVTQEADSLRKALKGLTGATNQEVEALEQTAEQTAKLEKEFKKYNDLLDDNAVKIAAIRNAKNKLNATNRLEAKLLAAAEGSYDQLSAKYSLMKIRLNQMSAAQRENTEAGREMEKQALKIYEQMNKLQKRTGKHTLEVGRYNKAWKNTLNTMEEIPGAAGNAASGVKGIGQAFKALLRNPVVLFLSAVVGGLAGLFAAFQRSEKGAEIMARAQGFLNGLWSKTIGLVADFVDGVISIVEEPREALVGFKDAIKEFLIDSLQGAINLGKALGEVLVGIATLDFEMIKEAAGDAGEAIVQMFTGMTSEEQAEFAEEVAKTTEELIKNGQAFADLESRRRAIARTNRALAKSLEDIITQEELARATADDTTLSFQARNEAAERARELSEERAKVEISLARNNLALINAEIDLRRANNEQIDALLDSQVNAYRELRNAERTYTLAVRDNERTRSELRQDELERNLDILIDGFDNQKTINERIIADDKRTLEERRALLNETVQLADDSFAKQIETIQEFTDVQVNANELIAESDAVVLNQKIRNLGLSEIIEGRLLEIVRERRLAIQDLAEADADLVDAEAEAALERARLQAEAEEAAYQARVEGFRQYQELKQSEFNLEERTEAEKTRFRLEAEKERLQQILALNEEFGRDLSAVQIQTIQNQIAALDRQLGAKGGDLFSRLGIDLGNEEKQALSQAIGFAKSQLDELTQARIQAADAAVSSAQREISAAQQKLDNELRAAELGIANRVAEAQAELQIAQRREEEALEQKKAAEKEQRTIDSLSQASSLVTAAAKIFSTVPFPTSLIAVSTMFGAFALAKVRASRLSKQFKEGGWEKIGGGYHSSGRDTFIGSNGDTDLYAEKDEMLAVFNAKATKKHGPQLGNWVDTINSGKLDRMYSKASATGTLRPVYVTNSTSKQSEALLREIRDGVTEKFIPIGDGIVLHIKGDTVKRLQYV